MAGNQGCLEPPPGVCARTPLKVVLNLIFFVLCYFFSIFCIILFFLDTRTFCLLRLASSSPRSHAARRLSSPTARSPTLALPAVTAHNPRSQPVPTQPRHRLHPQPTACLAFALRPQPALTFVRSLPSPSPTACPRLRTQLHPRLCPCPQPRPRRRPCPCPPSPSLALTVTLTRSPQLLLRTHFLPFSFTSPHLSLSLLQKGCAGAHPFLPNPPPRLIPAPPDTRRRRHPKLP